MVSTSLVVFGARGCPRRLAMTLIALALGGTIVGLGSPALAAPLVSAIYQFKGDSGPGYRYVSGDLPAEATARIAGQLTLAYDLDTGAAVITSLDGNLYSPVRIVRFSDSELAALDGADLESFVPGLFDGMTGERTSSGAFFEFGPRLATSSGLVGEYETRFEVSLSAGGARLLGQAAFSGDDGPTVFIDAALVQVPEPACGAVAFGAAAFAASSASRARRCSR